MLSEQFERIYIDWRALGTIFLEEGRLRTVNPFKKEGGGDSRLPIDSHRRQDTYTVQTRTLSFDLSDIRQSASSPILTEILTGAIMPLFLSF